VIITKASVNKDSLSAEGDKKCTADHYQKTLSPTHYIGEDGVSWALLRTRFRIKNYVSKSDIPKSSFPYASNT